LKDGLLILVKSGSEKLRLEEYPENELLFPETLPLKKEGALPALKVLDTVPGVGSALSAMPSPSVSFNTVTLNSAGVGSKLNPSKAWNENVCVPNCKFNVFGDEQLEIKILESPEDLQLILCTPTSSVPVKENDIGALLVVVSILSPLCNTISFVVSFTSVIVVSGARELKTGIKSPVKIKSRGLGSPVPRLDPSTTASHLKIPGVSDFIVKPADTPLTIFGGKFASTGGSQETVRVGTVLPKSPPKTNFTEYVWVSPTGELCLSGVTGISPVKTI